MEISGSTSPRLSILPTPAPERRRSTGTPGVTERAAGAGIAASTGSTASTAAVEMAGSSS